MEQVRELREVQLARARLPSDRQLAERFGVKLNTVRSYLRGSLPKRYFGKLG